MKQGTGSSRMGDGKVEPKSMAVDVGTVSRIGGHYVYTKTPSPLEAGRGYRAPMADCTIHHSGSQGKNK